MKKFVRSILILVLLTMAILGTYGETAHYFAWMNAEYTKQKPELNNAFQDVYQQILDLKKEDWFSFLQSTEELNETQTEEQDFSEYRAVCISYQEFNAYRIAAEENDASDFRKFFQSVLERCRQLNFNTVIVQVRPFGDALYESKYFPWAACISGAKGEDPGYDPLEIMVKETHRKGMKIEAWINPYRISVDESVNILPENDPAKQWINSKDGKRNVLRYESALYYNPSSEEVQNLVVNGVKEIVKNYDVDGIHMDDYFYPEFTKMNYKKAFDAKEYEKYKKNNVKNKSISIEKWRKNNVNELVKAIYQTCHENGVRFGISPTGNLERLRNNYEYYVDIDQWMNKKGFIDYVMPQIYWGFTNEEAPFQNILEDWSDLAEDPPVELYVGLQLYRIISADSKDSDYKELQSPDFLKNQIEEIRRKPEVKGFGLFSYRYMEQTDSDYSLMQEKANQEQRNILEDNVNHLKNSSK